MRRSLSQVVEEIKILLEREGELSIRQIAQKTGSQWRTAEKALELMKTLGVVKERENDAGERGDRLFAPTNRKQR